MTIYEITGAIGGDQYFRFAASKKDAKAHIAELREGATAELFELEIGEVELTNNRSGVVEVLNWFIDRTCLNEA